MDRGGKVIQVSSSEVFRLSLYLYCIYRSFCRLSPSLIRCLFNKYLLCRYVFGVTFSTGVRSCGVG